jgi:glycosyltransferase involved in cell wall biosynthesis
MKIVFLGKLRGNSILTGPEKFSLNLFNALKHDHEVIFIDYFFKNSPNSNFFTRLFDKKIIDETQNRLRLGNITLFLYLLKTRPEIIHILSAERFTIPIYIYKTFLNTKVVTTFHSILRYEIPNDVTRRNKFGRFKDYIWEALAIKFSDALVFLSQQHLNLAKQFYVLNIDKTTIIPQGVELEFYDPDRTLNLTSGINIVFYNGIESSIERGLNHIISSLNKMDSNVIKLYVIGKLEKIEDTKFPLEFVTPMNKKELVVFLKDKHILLKSNAYDSFSIFTAECMASGLIVIVSNNIGISCVIKDKLNGFVYDMNDKKEPTLTLHNILEQKYNTKAISENARKIIYELSWEKIKEYYLNLYRELNEN